VSSPLENRIAVVTGATSGIGNAIAHRLACKIKGSILNGRNMEKLKTLEQELRASGADVVGIAGDASAPEVVEAMLSRAHEEFGRGADLVIVNAGRGLSGSLLTSNPEEWDQVIRINVHGAMHLMRAAAKQMLSMSLDSAGTRDIVVLGSTVGRHISPFSSVYGATKFAVNSLAEALRRELAPQGIRVSLVEPGIVESGFQAVAGYEPSWFKQFADRIGPVLQPDDIARLVEFIVVQPPHVHINDVVIRPTRQDYP
jgi:NADP-dependent 3-hydroxy acid dehydrogenase YdfG